MVLLAKRTTHALLTLAQRLLKMLTVLTTMSTAYSDSVAISRARLITRISFVTTQITVILPHKSAVSAVNPRLAQKASGAKLMAIVSRMSAQPILNAKVSNLTVSKVSVTENLAQKVTMLPPTATRRITVEDTIPKKPDTALFATTSQNIAKMALVAWLLNKCAEKTNVILKTILLVMVT